MSTYSKIPSTWQSFVKICPHKITGYSIDLTKELRGSSNRTSFTHQVANNTGRDLSFKANKKIEESISWLVYLSKPKRALNPKTLTTFRFRINFLTLTLPSLQAHLDSTITAKCLNQFLTESRKTLNLRNYVWRAETQKNGNIHFHLISDVYMNAYIVREIWNRCLNKLGYIDRYQAKFKNCTFEAYRKLVDPQHKRKSLDLRNSWIFGIKTDWRKPNTTDIHSTKHVRNLAAYLSKYVTKKATCYAEIDVPTSRREKSQQVYELKERRLSSRLWGQSQSLSQLVKPIFEHDEHISKFMLWMQENFANRFFQLDFGIVMRVHMQEYVHKFRNFLTLIRDEVISLSDYSPSSQREQRFYSPLLWQIQPDI